MREPKAGNSRAQAIKWRQDFLAPLTGSIAPMSGIDCQGERLMTLWTVWDRRAGIVSKIKGDAICFTAKPSHFRSGCEYYRAF